MTKLPLLSLVISCPSVSPYTLSLRERMNLPLRKKPKGPPNSEAVSLLRWCFRGRQRFTHILFCTWSFLTVISQLVTYLWDISFTENCDVFKICRISLLPANKGSANFVIAHKASAIIFRLRRDYGSIISTMLRIQRKLKNKKEQRIGKFEIASSFGSIYKFPHRVRFKVWKFSYIDRKLILLS